MSTKTLQNEGLSEVGTSGRDFCLSALRVALLVPSSRDRQCPCADARPPTPARITQEQIANQPSNSFSATVVALGVEMKNVSGTSKGCMSPSSYSFRSLVSDN